MNEYYEEAKDVLMNTAWMGTDNGAKVFDAIKIATEALDKQIPKKPKVEVEGSVEFGGCYGVYFCPSCYEYERNKKWKRRISYDQNYCDVCGQRIDWSELEE